MCNGLEKLRKIKVAFFLNDFKDWSGGLNYYKNLLLAIIENKDLNIEPIVFISSDTDIKIFKGYPSEVIHKIRMLSRWNWLWIVDKLYNKFFNHAVIKDYLLKKYKIDIVSHVVIDHKVSIPQIAWIPDFQHKYLPEMFSENEIEQRDRCFTLLANKCKLIILSSYCAQRDFIKFYSSNTLTGVLQFVVDIENNNIVDVKVLQKKYGIIGKFFYMPNQYWKHKNHIIVLQALNILKKIGKDILVVSTGSTYDYRNKTHFAKIEEYMNKHKLKDNYMILGKVPYSDVQVLAKYCISFINPSLFEGWSTTVEEAKAMNKKIVLSDISVHREQAPEYGIFFDSANAEQLAEILWNVWCSDDCPPSANIQKLNKANKRRFAIQYRKILEKAIEK
ncbi:glycosyltransferase family 4 protein [Pectinatus frisingensis]|uniref:glycosyltransferase family 4 protein n=1 Tax=Pectinatus frisingensis TaxID=865 RepID=UPI0018C6C666|nr:glycosyltransferase family 1 protein [Pectinatus frisingensis]